PHTPPVTNLTGDANNREQSATALTHGPRHRRRIINMNEVPPPEGVAQEPYLEPPDFWTKAASLIGIVTPVVGLVVAIVLTWGWGFDWMHAALLAGMYLLTAVGVTVGYHRLFTHCSFK